MSESAKESRADTCSINSPRLSLRRYFTLNAQVSASRSRTKRGARPLPMLPMTDDDRVVESEITDMKKLLIIIGVILVTFILLSISLYRRDLFSNRFSPANSAAAAKETKGTR